MTLRVRHKNEVFLPFIAWRKGNGGQPEQPLPSGSKMFREERDVLKVQHLWRSPAPGGWKGHFDDIESEGPWPLAQQREVAFNGTLNRPFLPRIDGIVSSNRCTRPAGLDLHEYEHLGVATDEVDFVAFIRRSPPIPRDEMVATFPSQPLGCELLAARTGIRRFIQ